MTKQERLEETIARLARYNTNIKHLQGAIMQAEVELASLKNGMTMEEIKKVWANGATVCWATDNYEILQDCIGQWLIWSKDNDHYVGLTEAYVKDCYIKQY